MSANDCSAARARLGAWVATGARSALASELAAHLASCAECGAWTRAELALERLLGAEARETRSDVFLARRVLERLSGERARPAQADLEAAAQQAETTARDALDVLLERVPAPAPPANFERELLRALAPARAREGRAPRARLRRRWSLAALAAACALALLAAGWSLLDEPRSMRADGTDGHQLASAPQTAELDDPPLELLEQLELFELWELVVPEGALAAEQEAWLEEELAFWAEGDEAPLELEAPAAVAEPARARATEGG